MNVSYFLTYALASGLAAGCGAWLLERGLWSQRFPARGVWVAALGISVWLPLTALVTAAADPASPMVASVAQATGEGRVDDRQAPVIGAPAAAGLDILGFWGDLSGGMLATATSGLPDVAFSAARVGLVWAMGSTLFAIVVLMAWLRFIRRASRWPHATVLGRKVRISPAVGPATFGLISPKIVIPRWSTDLPKPELDLILQHEEEHVRNRDTALLAVGILAAIACPWNPAIWWQLRRLKAAIEVDCDRRVLRRGVAANRYGHLLVQLGTRGNTAPFALPSITGPISQLERRLKLMLKSGEGSSFPGAVAAVVVGVMLMVGACTSDAPVAADMEPAEQASTAAEPADAEVISIWVARNGEVQVNGSVQPVERVSEAVSRLAIPETVVSLQAHVAVPYAVVAAVQEELRRAQVLRVVFVTTDGDTPRPTPPDLDALLDTGLAVVLPESNNPNIADMRELAERNPRNLLFLEVLPSGAVATRLGADPSVREISPDEVEGVWREEVAENPNLIAYMETDPDAEYRHMYRVLDAVQSAGATRFTLQVRR